MLTTEETIDLLDKAKNGSDLAKENYNGKNPYPQNFGVRVSLCKREKWKYC